MIDELKDHSLADATLVNLEAALGKMKVLIRDWRERTFWLCFEDVLAFQAIQLASGDLSHADDAPSDTFLQSSAAALGENPTDYRCIVIVEADDDRVVLKVVAKTVRVEEGRDEQ